jgi:hypothetical protein
LQTGRTALLFGGVVASVLSGIYIFLPPGTDPVPADRFEVATGFFVSLISLFIVAEVFYRRLAPITDGRTLLVYLSNDLKRCPEGCRLLFCFEALNVGHFRAVTGAYDSLFDGFLSSFRAAVKDATRVRALTLPVDQYAAYYRTYVNPRMEHTADIERIDALCTCLESAYELAHIIQSKGRNCLLGMARSSLPPRTFVIGDVVYSFIAWGMPISGTSDDGQASDSEFRAVDHSSKPVELLIYRRQDPVLAQQLEDDFALATETGREQEPVHTGVSMEALEEYNSWRGRSNPWRG